MIDVDETTIEDKGDQEITEVWVMRKKSTMKAEN